ncbi:hypothetical protein EFA46_000715 [Halarchaeum sp. CBA1220]|uniref:DUF7553 family protein n=1 Tax=Halarchaeum sp. CBA1220 TaxID=1853682 RepID=UPI000F3A9A5D|nr:hypothetical protein [Halarchaeum sp. CBA1220]QLC32789.1 hypothetical protein EFA46_000715 [Halarchaeum sp. CBA1220]
MNRHLDDARYHLGRTAYHVVAGVRTEATPYETRVRHLLGRDHEREPTRSERVQHYAERARGDVESYVTDARSVLVRRAE